MAPQNGAIILTVTLTVTLTLTLTLILALTHADCDKSSSEQYPQATLTSSQVSASLELED